MHDDLIDAVEWTIERGYADRARVAIFGGSYGGYAALAGVTFTPDVFCGAVDIVGSVNLVTLIKAIPPYWSTMLSTLHRRAGNPETESEFLRSRSPLFKADRIKVPLPIAQGAKDPRVLQAESEQLVAVSAGERHRARVRVVSGRGSWLRQARESSPLLCYRRAISCHPPRGQDSTRKKPAPPS